VKTIRVTVTRRLIEKGTPGDPYNCPVGLAIDTVLPGKRGMHSISTAIGRGVECRQYGAIVSGQFCRYPDDVCQWVMDFDAREPVSEIAFNLTIPEGAP